MFNINKIVSKVLLAFVIFTTSNAFAVNFIPQLPSDMFSRMSRGPVAIIKVDCAATTCTFNSADSHSPGSQIVSWEWQMGDGNAYFSATSNHDYANQGNYEVILTVGDANGRSSTTTTYVNIKDDSGTRLYSGQAVNNIGGTAGSEQFYFLETSGNNAVVDVQISGGTGDVDLFVKVDGIASSGDYTCRPYLAGNNESCLVHVPSTTDVGIMLQGYSPFDSVSLIATEDLQYNNYPKYQLAGGRNEWTYFGYLVPQGVYSVTFTTTGSSGDVNLALRKDVEPTQTNYDCYSNNSGNTESCTINVMPGDNIKVGLQNVVHYGGVVLTLN